MRDHEPRPIVQTFGSADIICRWCREELVEVRAACGICASGWSTPHSPQCPKCETEESVFSVWRHYPKPEPRPEYL